MPVQWETYEGPELHLVHVLHGTETHMGRVVECAYFAGGVNTGRMRSAKTDRGIVVKRATAAGGGHLTAWNQGDNSTHGTYRFVSPLFKTEARPR